VFDNNGRAAVVIFHCEVLRGDSVHIGITDDHISDGELLLTPEALVLALLSQLDHLCDVRGEAMEP